MAKDPNGCGLTRRSILKAAGATSAAGVVKGAAADVRAFNLLSRKELTKPDRSVPTFCELCFWNCGVIAEVSANQILSLRGYPNAPPAEGRLCGRGNVGAGFVRDEDGLKYPMVRAGKRAEGRFKRVGWMTASQTIARAFKTIKAEHGPEALALFYHGAGGPLLQTMMVDFW